MIDRECIEVDTGIIGNIGLVIKLPGDLKRIQIEKRGNTCQNPSDNKVVHSLGMNRLARFPTEF
jgi:hypothetical protein